MKNNISIDDLFRKELAGGKEQLNLGAWANMERMLDGKNPYPIEEDKRKRRIAPLFWLLLLICGGAAIVMKSLHKPGTSEPMAKHQAINPKSVVASSNTQNALPLENQVPILLDEKPELKQEPIASSISNTGGYKSSNANKIATSTQSNQRQQSVQNSEMILRSSDAENPSVSNSNVVNTTSSNQSTNDINKKKVGRKEGRISNTTVVQNSSNAADLNPQTATSKEQAKSTNNSGEAMLTASPLQSHTETVEIPTVFREQKIEHNAKGTSVAVNYDTIKETITSKLISKQVSNPRAVALNSEQETLAQQQVTPPAEKPELSAASPSQDNHSASVDPDVKIRTKAHDKNSGLGGKLQTAAQVLGGGIALAAQKIASKRPIIYPALTAGVNMATSKQNYGGFQVGISNATKLNDYLSLLVDLKLLYRLNSGYSVKDYQTSFKSISSIDAATLAQSNQTIYTYQMDSTVRKYNFKSMWAVEVPVSIQYHLRKLSFYTGINLAFNPALNTTTVISNNVSEHKDIVSNTVNFVPSANSNYQYAQEDFKARWGMGYMLGASYSFNPRLYVDMRFTQTIWDNAKTNASRSISTEVYKVPYLQLSLGYRFKDFTNDR